MEHLSSAIEICARDSTASPYTAPEGVQKHGDLEFKWLPLLQTPCYGFSGPYACYSSTCTHNPTLNRPPKHVTSGRRAYSIASKPAFFSLFRQTAAVDAYEQEMPPPGPLCAAPFRPEPFHSEPFRSEPMHLQLVPFISYGQHDDLR